MAKLTDFSGRPTSGTVATAVIAIVTDNVDPDKLGRIKVKFPTLPDEPTSFWLRQASPNAGVERGLYALPEVDDEVLVVFLQGSQDVGVIIGQLWNGVDKPPPEAADGAKGKIHASKFGNDATAGSGTLDDNDRRFWKSRSGALFIFDDKDGSETVEIWDKSRSLSIVMDTANKKIQISNKDGNIEISAGGDITLTAAGNVKYDAGSDIAGKAGGGVKINAGTDIKYESGTDTSFKCLNFKAEASVKFSAKGTLCVVDAAATGDFKAGAMATFQGSAMAKVTGGIVMIN